MSKAIALSPNQPFSDLLLKSVVRSIQKVLHKDRKSVITPEATIGMDLGADSLDSQDIIIGVENVWGISLRLEQQPGYGFLKLKVKELTDELIDSLKKLFKVKNPDNPATILRLHIRQSILYFFKKNYGKRVVQDDSGCHHYIDDDMKIVGGLYMTSDDIKDLETYLRNRFSVANKFHIIEHLDKFGDLKVRHICHIVFNVLARKTKILPRRRKDL